MVYKFDKIQFNLFYLIMILLSGLYLRINYQIKDQENLTIFSINIFIVLAHTFDWFWVNFCKGYKVKATTLFSKLLSSCWRTICWRHYSFIIECSWQPSKNQLAIDVWEYFWTSSSIPLAYISILIQIPRCSDYYNFVVRFEKIKCQSEIVFQDCLGYSGSSAIRYLF